MESLAVQRPTWRETLAAKSPLILPSAHDALVARLIHRAGFTAYQVGGFAVAAALHAVPDVDLEHLGEKMAVARTVIDASPLPVLVDGDDGYGDVKNVTRTIREYERLGASAIFIEDQVAPKRCGHMAGKSVVPMDEMVKKIRAAAAARRSSDFFLLARTDAIAPHGVDDAIRRAHAYLAAGADGVYLEGPTSIKELERIGKEFRDVPLAVSELEDGGKTPWLSPADFGELGFDMILYPTTVLFRMVYTIQDALSGLLNGHKIDAHHAVDMKEFEEIVGMDNWAEIERKFS